MAKMMTMCLTTMTTMLHQGTMRALIPILANTRVSTTSSKVLHAHSNPLKGLGSIGVHAETSFQTHRGKDLAFEVAVK
eukprot:2512460-Ditylum_brightwellii.AAC.1